MAEKTDSDRILETVNLCQEHFGAVTFVGLKYHQKLGWIAKAQLDNEDFGNLTADGTTSTEAIKKLRNRVKKIIKRYNGV